MSYLLAWLPARSLVTHDPRRTRWENRHWVWIASLQMWSVKTGWSIETRVDEFICAFNCWKSQQCQRTGSTENIASNSKTWEFFCWNLIHELYHQGGYWEICCMKYHKQGGLSDLKHIIQNSNSPPKWSPHHPPGTSLPTFFCLIQCRSLHSTQHFPHFPFIFCTYLWAYLPFSRITDQPPFKTMVVLNMLLILHLWLESAQPQISLTSHRTLKCVTSCNFQACFTYNCGTMHSTLYLNSQTQSHILSLPVCSAKLLVTTQSQWNYLGQTASWRCEGFSSVSGTDSIPIFTVLLVQFYQTTGTPWRWGES